MNQENKPKLDFSKLLYENCDIVDDECIQILSNSANLLNMEVLDFSAFKMGNINEFTLFINLFYGES